MKTSKYWINELDLIPHPEGGYFKEIYRSSEKINSNALPNRFKGSRYFSTSIYFLLEDGQFSTFHKIKSDETWHFYYGYPLTIYVIDDNGKLIKHKLGISPEKEIYPQITIPANRWFAAKSEGNYTLVGCTVSPGFDFADFEMADRLKLIEQFPNQEKLIVQFTKG